MRPNEAHANGVCGAEGPRASTFVFLSRSVGEIVSYFHRAAESTAEGESLVAPNALTLFNSSVFIKFLPKSGAFSIRFIQLHAPQTPCR